MGRYKEHSIGFGGAGSDITIFGMLDYAGGIDDLIASGRGEKQNNMDTCLLQ